MYSAANQEFVRATVEQFYLKENEDSRPLATLTTENVIESNQAGVKKCASTQLQLVYDILHNLRVVVDHLMRLSYFYYMIQINLLRFVFMEAMGPKPESNTENPDEEESHAWGQALRYWELFIDEAEKLFKALGDLVYEFIMDSGFGQVLQQMLDAICQAIQFLIDNMWIDFFCNTILKKLGDWCVEGFFGIAPLKRMGLQILEFHRQECNIVD